MISMKCPACGGKCNFEYDKGYVCEFCGNVYDGKENSDSITDKLNYANTKRIEEYDFERALELCREVLKESPDNQSANWCALLSEYQIAYLQDAKGNYKPTLLNPDVSVPINKCGYYNKLNSTYKRMADLAETVRLDVVRESKQLPEYDVFISYKQHVEKSDTISTEEAGWAAEIYKRLTKCGLRVFYGEVSLNEGTAGWEPHIYSALKSSKYLIVLGSSVKNIDSAWVKNEWKRFLSYRKKDDGKTFTVVRKNFKPEELDFELQSQQMLDADKADWIDKLVEKVNGHLTKGKIQIFVEEAQAFILKRQFNKAKQCYLKVCGADQRNSKGYWGLLMCKLKAMDDYDLVKCNKKISKTVEYDNAVRYATGEEREHYEKVCRDNLTRNTIGYERKNYNEWKKRTKVSRFFKTFFIVLFAALLCASAVLGVLYYRDLKSKEYYLQLDYGESAGGANNITIKAGEPIPVLPKNLTIQDKYYMDFVGWFTEPNCKGVKISDAEGKSELKVDNKITSLSNGAHQIKLYAGFEVHKYSVTFYDSDGHTVLKTIKSEYGTPLEDIGSEICVGNKQVYTWAEKLGGEDFTEKITKDTKLYATSYAIKVIYETNGGISIPGVVVKIGEKVPMPIPQRQYYGFEGWQYNGETVQYGFTAPQENIVLKAKWQRTHYSVSLDGAVQYVRIGDSITLPTRKMGYDIEGWSNNGILYNGEFTPTADSVLASVYRVALNANGGTVSSATKAIAYNSVYTLPVPTKEGHKFGGWYTGLSSSAQQITDNKGEALAKWSPVSDLTLYAVWIKDYYIDLNRVSCNDKYTPADAWIGDINSHNNWELAQLAVIDGTKNASSQYYIADGIQVKLGIKLLQDINDLPKINVIESNILGKHYAKELNLSDDTYNGEVYNTNIKGKKIGLGAYYIKCTLSNGSVMQFNKTDIFRNAKKGDIIEINLDEIAMNQVVSIEFVLIYEVRLYVYNGGWYTNYPCWRCSATVNFNS